MSDILISNEAGVLTLTFNRLEKKNAISQAMYAAMAAALVAAAADKSNRVTIIQGDAALFTSGNDLADFVAKPPTMSAGASVSEIPPVYQFLRAISTHPKPIIAAVCGQAVGIGTTLLLHCDYVVAGDNAKLSMPFVNLGLCPEAASSYLLPALIGHTRAAELLLFGDSLSAEQALSLGLVNKVTPAAEAGEFALAQALKLASKPLASLVATKALMKRPHAAMIAESIAEENVIFGRMLREPAAIEAFTAFMQKRKPDFSSL